jgi:hypothetical protein
MDWAHHFGLLYVRFYDTGQHKKGICYSAIARPTGDQPKYSGSRWLKPKEPNITST